jgi:mono/diheme cytochrome c family protein
MMTRKSAMIGSLVALGMALLLSNWTGARDKDWPVPAEAAKLKNPVKATPENLAAARAIYMDKCANCHGEKGFGDGPEAGMYDPPPASLADAPLMNGMPDGEIYWKITEGRKPMPSFKNQLSDEQRWQLVNFLRTLVPKPAVAKKPGASKP